MAVNSGKFTYRLRGELIRQSTGSTELYQNNRDGDFKQRGSFKKMASKKG